MCTMKSFILIYSDLYTKNYKFDLRGFSPKAIRRVNRGIGVTEFSRNTE